jgi:hypothetical protein
VGASWSSEFCTSIYTVPCAENSRNTEYDSLLVYTEVWFPWSREMRAASIIGGDEHDARLTHHMSRLKILYQRKKRPFTYSAQFKINLMAWVYRPWYSFNAGGYIRQWKQMFYSKLLLTRIKCKIHRSNYCRSWIKGVMVKIRTNNRTAGSKECILGLGHLTDSRSCIERTCSWLSFHHLFHCHVICLVPTASHRQTSNEKLTPTG